MADISHQFGQDLTVSAPGDLATVTGIEEGRQRVLRRLLTNPGAYIFQPAYGAGLGRFVGKPINEAQIIGVIREQMFLEACVARTPAPVISVQASPGLGVLIVTIQYVDANAGIAVPLTFQVGTPTTSPTGT